MNISLAREWALAIVVTGLAIGSIVAVHLVQLKAPAKPQPAPVVVVTPSPILRDTLPAGVARPDPVPLPRPRPKHKAATKTLPTSPYPCPLVRWAVHEYGRAELDSKASENGVTEEQRKAALACLKG